MTRVTIEVVDTKVDALTDGLVDLKKTVLEQANSFVLRENFELRLREIDAEHLRIRQDMLAMDKKHEDENRKTNGRIDTIKSKNWITHSLSAVLGAILAGMVELVVLLLAGKH